MTMCCQTGAGDEKKKSFSFVELCDNLRNFNLIYSTLVEAGFFLLFIFDSAYFLKWEKNQYKTRH